MLIDFQSKFNHFNYFLFSDEVSSCDFEFSSVLRSSGWVVVVEGMGELEKTWMGCGPFNKSPFIELLQLLQIYIIMCFFLHLFWHCEVHNWISYKLLTNFELANFNQVPLSSFSVFLFAICDFWLTKKNLLLHKSDVRGYLKKQVGYFTTKCCDDIFLQPPKRFASWLKFSPLGFCLLVVNHSSCRDWITDKYWLTFGFE